MERYDVEERIFKLIGISMAPEQPFAAQPGWDSLRHAELIIELQRDFGVSFKATEILAMKTPAAALDAVMAALARRK